MKTAIITGGLGGIGAAIARRLAEQNVACLVTDLGEGANENGSMFYHRADISDEASLSTLVRASQSRFPDGIDYIIHCAAQVHYSTILQTDRATWLKVIQTNLIATIDLIAKLSPLIRQGGRVVLFGSGTVFKGPKEMFAYVASKAGVVGFAKCLADELGSREICVNVISPGMTQTPMIKDFAGIEDANIATRAIKRSAYVDDIVGPVMFLLSDDAKFVTGQTICVDGGSVRR